MTEVQYTNKQKMHIENSHMLAKVGSHYATHIGMAFVTGGASLWVSLPTIGVTVLALAFKLQVQNIYSVGIENDAQIAIQKFSRKGEQNPIAKGIKHGMFEGAVQAFTRPIGYIATAGAIAIDLIRNVLRVPQAAIVSIIPIKEKDQKIRKIFTPEHPWGLTHTAMQAFANGKVFSHLHPERPNYKSAYQNRLPKKRIREN